mmetsp:Transcript_17971/g.39614  ORF Transcript_17971/g.39614 Transcript_17971/m.39614 type:complete len:116 (-) Transcript_17971:265-612(-)
MPKPFRLQRHQGRYEIFCCLGSSGPMDMHKAERRRQICVHCRCLQQVSLSTASHAPRLSAMAGLLGPHAGLAVQALHAMLDASAMTASMPWRPACHNGQQDASKYLSADLSGLQQ